MSDSKDEVVVENALQLGLAWRFLRRARSAIMADMNASRTDYGLEAGDIDTIDQIALAGGQGLMSDIAEGLLIDRSTATRAVTRLVERRIVERRGDPADARLIRVSLTEFGKQVHDDLRDRRLEFGMRLLERFDSDDQDAIARLAARLADAVADELGVSGDRPWIARSEAANGRR